MPSRGFFDTNLFRRSHGCLVLKAAATAAAKQLTKIASHFFHDNAVEAQNVYLTKPNEMQFSTMSFSARPRRFCQASRGTK